MKLTSDKRASSIVWLILCVVISLLVYWYPIVLAHTFERDADSRVGFVGVLTIPVLFAAGTRAIWEFVRLRKEIRSSPQEGNRAYHTAGVILLIVSLSPLAAFTVLMIWGATR
jgi:hypothetical protein